MIGYCLTVGLNTQFTMFNIHFHFTLNDNTPINKQKFWSTLALF